MKLRTSKLIIDHFWLVRADVDLPKIKQPDDYRKTHVF